MGFEALARVSPMEFGSWITFAFRQYQLLTYTDDLDSRSLLQEWRQSGYNLRLQHRKLQTLQIRGGCIDGDGQGEVVADGSAR